MTTRRAVLAAAALAAVLGLWTLTRDRPDPLDRAVAAVMAPGIEGAVVAFGPLGQAPEVRVYGTAGAGASEPLSGMSRFRFASLTKPVTSAAVTALAARGALSLDDRLPQLLPEIAFTDPRMQAITLRDLLRHTSGIDEGADLPPLFLPPEVLRAELGLDAEAQSDCRGIAGAMAARPLGHPPGTQTVYSNIGYCFLGLILEARTGLTLEAALHDLVPQAAGLTFDPKAATVAHSVPEAAQDLLVLNPSVAGAAGGLIGSPVAYHGFLARPLAQGVTDPPPFAVEGSSYWGIGWRIWPDRDCPKRTHFGSMPGAYSVAVVDAAGNGFVAFFNGRPAADGPPFAALAEAACAVFPPD